MLNKPTLTYTSPSRLPKTNPGGRVAPVADVARRRLEHRREIADAVDQAAAYPRTVRR